MHAIKGGWVGQALALATSNDPGRKKSRIRRSKEERKDMVESYIKRYQKSNNGNFPSLNLTHKEVGGSFYTVREIVREIIQENRVLAPPKVSVDENEHTGFLEQNPLGTLSIEPKTDSQGLANVVNGSGMFEKDQEYDLVVIDAAAAPIRHPAYSEETSLPSSHEFGGSGSERLTDELYFNSGYERGKEEKGTMCAQQTSSDSAGLLIPDIQKDREKVEASQAVTSHSNVVIERFPLRPISSRIHDMDVEAGEVHETTESLEDKAIEPEKMSSIQSSNYLVIEKDMKKNQDLETELNHEYREEKTELNPQTLSLESLNMLTVVETDMLDVGDLKDGEGIHSLPDGTKVFDSTESFISEDSILINRKSRDCENTSLQNGSDRINSETSEEEASEKSIRESNPVMALIKAFFSAFVRFWTE